jgi:protein gp37
MGETKIEWTEKVWNPVTGCTKVSQGCKNCYAERVFPRPYPGRAFTDVRTHPDRLNDPMHWRKPCRIFVNSMSDLFHEAIPDDFIFAVFVTMARAKQHTFQALTKRAKRMCDLLCSWQQKGLTLREGCGAVLPNVWLGVSVEDQKTADERIPLLLQTPAAVRWISAEPLLGPIDLRYLHFDGVCEIDSLAGTHGVLRPHGGANKRLDWVVVGGESGPHARPMRELWARELVQHCQVHKVPVFMKQGSQANWPDFKNFDTFPEDLKIRQYPEVTDVPTL